MKLIIKFLQTFIFVVLLAYPSYAQIDMEKIKEIYAQIDMEKIKEIYKEELSLYPKKLTDHFLDPEKANFVYFGLNVPGAANLNAVTAIFICDSTLATTIEEKMIHEAVAIYHFTDSCLMIVDYDTSIYDTTVIKLKQCNNFNGMLPVPNFEFFLEHPLPIEFYKKATIYVLGAEKGKFLDEDLLWSRGVKLPDEWKNGYTKGVVISGNIVAYWLEVW
jgi:hypothetical protein